MTGETGNTVKQLSREAERTRDQLTTTVSELNQKLASTVDDLKVRLSPSHVKSEVQGYVRDESREILSSLQRRARENPLQAVAVGAAVAYPFWGLLKSVPVPVLLIGGGLLLSKQNKVKVPQAFTESATHAAHSASDIKDATSAAVDGAAAKASDGANNILDSATAATNDAIAAVKDVSVNAIDTVSATASELGEAGVRAAKQSRSVLEDLINKNPLLVGGIALAVGAFVAASIPITGTENRLFGEGSDKVKDKAMDAVSEGVERAKEVAAGMVGEAAAAATRAGLSKDDLSKTIEGAATTVKSVVDTALASALGDDKGEKAPSDTSPQTPANGVL